MNSHSRVLGTFSLAMITVAAIVSLRNLPVSAVFGFSSVFYYIVAAFAFFIPIGLVTAELASSWPRAGGNYVWVSEAFGKKYGFFALWMAWMESIAWFPAILAFTATMLAHMVAPLIPGLENSKYFTFFVMIGVFWGSTLLNFAGIKVSGLFSSLGVLLGTIIPGALIIGLGILWVVLGKPLQIEFTMESFIPSFDFENMVIFSGMLLGLAGVELAAFHINESKDPQRSYPRALIIATFIILTISILGTLAISVVVPNKELSLLSGLIQAFAVFFNSFNMGWVVPMLAFFLFLGSLAGINTWTIGPAKGLMVTAKDGFLPPSLQNENTHGAPVGMLLFQGIVGTILSLVFLYMDSNSAAFWILTALSAQFTMIQYIFVLAAVIKLRYSQSNTKRPYKVPGGKIGIWLVSLIGILGCLFGFWIVYVPPSQLDTGDKNIYQLMLVISLLLLTLPPVLLAKLRNDKWKN